MKSFWLRLLGNAGVSFFTSLSAMTLVDVGDGRALYAAFLVAGIQAGLVFFKDMRDAAEKRKPKDHPFLTLF